MFYVSKFLFSQFNSNVLRILHLFTTVHGVIGMRVLLFQK